MADIQEWSNKRGKDHEKQEKILIFDGWEPEKYRSSMKASLFSYLDKWHLLSDKDMPTPLTSSQLRQNPYTKPNTCKCPFCN